MQKTTISLQMLNVNQVFAANEDNGIKGSNEMIEKYKKLSKTRKLSKSQKSAKSDKNCQKVGIHLILIYIKIGQVFNFRH